MPIADSAPLWTGPARVSRSRDISVRGRRYQLREWGPPDAAPVLLLHGARDGAATFQFLVDALPGDWRFIAPDWRGHGGSDWTPGNYWLSDFVGDLDALVDEIGLGVGLSIIAHSMGANIASLYAGLRPERVSRLVLLDALGNMLDLSPVPIVETLLRQLRSIRPRAPGNAYPSLAAMAERLMAANARLGVGQAQFLAAALSRPAADGGYVWSKDPSFVRSFPTLHTTEEWSACWARIVAPVLCLFSSDPRPHAVTTAPAEVRARAAHFRDIRIATIPDTGHNLHHDAPDAVAAAIHDFFERTAP